VNHSWKILASVSLLMACTALMLPATWTDVSAGAQHPTTPVALRTVSNEGGHRSAPVVAVVKPNPAVDIPEEVTLLVVGAVLVGLAGVLRRPSNPQSAANGPRRSHIKGVTDPSRELRGETGRRLS
jgi:hypothetical protein